MTCTRKAEPFDGALWRCLMFFVLRVRCMPPNLNVSGGDISMRGCRRGNKRVRLRRKSECVAGGPCAVCVGVFLCRPWLVRRAPPGGACTRWTMSGGRQLVVPPMRPCPARAMHVEPGSRDGRWPAPTLGPTGMGVALRGCCWPRLAKQGCASLRVLEGPNISLAGGSAASVTGGLHTPAWGAKGSNVS